MRVAWPAEQQVAGVWRHSQLSLHKNNMYTGSTESLAWILLDLITDSGGSSSSGSE